MPLGLPSPLAAPDRVTLGASLQVGGVPVQAVRGRGFSVKVALALALVTNKVLSCTRA